MEKPISRLLALAAMLAAGSAQAAGDAVWRYTDDSGKVVYSNVQQKGKKGEKLDIMKFPPPEPSSYQPYVSLEERAAARAQPQQPQRGMAEADGIAVSPEMLARLRGGSEKPPIPPGALPPLPSDSQGGEVPASFSSLQLRPSLPSVEASADGEPAWAKGRATPASAPKASAPSWAKDPFSNP